MRNRTASDATHTTTGHGRGDLGRRLASRRAALGLTRREAAERAGMAVAYLEYLEETPGSAPGRSTLLRLAGALETTVSALAGGDVDAPPGRGPAGRDRELAALTAPECWERLGTHGVGRLAVTGAEGPTVLPVNYSVVDGTIAFRTAAGSVPSQTPGRRVAFEVDHIDEALSTGWSVLVRGRARGVTDPALLRRLRNRSFSTPWAGGRREMWICVDAVSISGRTIRQNPS
ncbi:helix-turn-helix domain-containing protein [Streptomyces sp. NPDC093094]|uniref:helix-turn-helix domain-containing protein n=1 Tax=Streptomyces sp. NPDC093094 TaxID=3366026 RepID=UPI0038068A54